MKHRTLEEYKEDVFDLLDEKTKLEWMYQMSEQLCKIDEFIKERQQFYNKWNEKMFDEVLKLLGND